MNVEGCWMRVGGLVCVRDGEVIVIPFPPPPNTNPTIQPFLLQHHTLPPDDCQELLNGWLTVLCWWFIVDGYCGLRGVWGLHSFHPTPLLLTHTIHHQQSSVNLS